MPFFSDPLSMTPYFFNTPSQLSSDLSPGINNVHSLTRTYFPLSTLVLEPGITPAQTCQCKEILSLSRICMIICHMERKVVYMIVFIQTRAQRALTSVQTISAFTFRLFGRFPIYPSSPQPPPSHFKHLSLLLSPHLQPL